MLTQRITKCCSAPVVRHSGKEYPDGRTFYINTEWDACNECKEHWPETIPQCDCCGEGSELLIETNLGNWCKECTLTYADDLMEKA